MDPKPPILSLSATELEKWLADHDAPEYRRKQVWTWLARGASSFDAMRDVPRALRDELDRDFRISSLQSIAVSQADNGLTTKTLFELDGGHSVEAVVMRYSERSTLCISSQAGCPIGCPFCATGKFPFGRNLNAHEIVEQAVDAVRLLAVEGRRLSHVVFMGMGEPMANYRAVVESVRRLSDPDLLAISPRRIVVSTSGLIPRIEQLGSENIPVTLAISLHAARDELRDVLVPINRKYPVRELVDAAQGYADKTGRRVSYECATLAGSKMLGFYGERLNGVELNGSFYRTPPESTLLNWAVQTPPGFRFCMKANRGLTYSAEAFDKVGLARIFTERIAILGDRLGPVLLQFPPTRQ